MVDEMIEQLERLYSKRDRLEVQIGQLEEKSERAAADGMIQEIAKVEADIQSIEAALANL